MKNVYTDQDETKEVQEIRTDYFEKKGDQKFTEDGRNAEITVDLVLQKTTVVNGPEDAVVSEISRDFAFGEDLHKCEVFPGPVHGTWRLPARGRVRTGLPVKTRCRTEEGSVMSKWYASCVNDAYGEGESDRNLEQVAHRRGQQDKLSTFTGAGCKRKDLPC